jgi:hypothetical protein
MDNLTNILAFLTLLAFFIGLIKNITTKTILAILIAITVLVVTIAKNKQDSKSADESKKKSEASDSVIASISVKLDSSISYIIKVDSLGVKRDSVRNTPVVTKKFVNYINYVKELNQH